MKVTPQPLQEIKKNMCQGRFPRGETCEGHGKFQVVDTDYKFKTPLCVRFPDNPYLLNHALMVEDSFLIYRVLGAIEVDKKNAEPKSAKNMTRFFDQNTFYSHSVTVVHSCCLNE